MLKCSEMGNIIKLCILNVFALGDDSIEYFTATII